MWDYWEVLKEFRVVVMIFQYSACFGCELAMNNQLATHFRTGLLQPMGNDLHFPSKGIQVLHLTSGFQWAFHDPTIWMWVKMEDLGDHRC
jgi:hypothetical protein